MGEITDMILDGYLCEVCGTFIDQDAAGYPRRCEEHREYGEEIE